MSHRLNSYEFAEYVVDLFIYLEQISLAEKAVVCPDGTHRPRRLAWEPVLYLLLALWGS